MPISVKLENKLSFTLLIEGEDVFRFKKLIEAGQSWIVVGKTAEENLKKDGTVIVSDNNEILRLAENILQRFK